MLQINQTSPDPKTYYTLCLSRRGTVKIKKLGNNFEAVQLEIKPNNQWFFLFLEESIINSSTHLILNLLFSTSFPLWMKLIYYCWLSLRSREIIFAIQSHLLRGIDRHLIFNWQLIAKSDSNFLIQLVSVENLTMHMRPAQCAI